MVTQSIVEIAGLLISGGFIGKLIDTFFISKKDKIDANSKIIQQLQDLVIANINRQNELQKDVDYWRREYNELHKENQNIINEKEDLRKQVETLTRQYADLKKKYDQLIKKGEPNAIH